MKASVPLPHPDCIAARKALAALPQPPLEKVMEQARASEEWRKNNGYGPGSKRAAADSAEGQLSARVPRAPNPS